MANFSFPLDFPTLIILMSVKKMRWEHGFVIGGYGGVQGEGMHRGVGKGGGRSRFLVVSFGEGGGDRKCVGNGGSGSGNGWDMVVVVGDGGWAGVGVGDWGGKIDFYKNNSYFYRIFYCLYFFLSDLQL